MSFGKNLRYLRHKQRVSQEALAEKLGYKNYTTIQKWESNISEPSVERLKLIAEFFGVSMDELLNRDLTTGDRDTYGNHGDNLAYFANNPELLDLYQKIYESESLQLLFDSAKDLTPEDLEAVLIHIQGIRKARGLD